MALIFEGNSSCPVCGEVLDGNKAYIGTPPFVSNQLDDLIVFNDCGIHIACLDAHPLKNKLNKLLDQYYAMLESKRCIVDQQVISSNEDFFCTGLLTSDSEEELFRFNFLVINRKNMWLWKDRDEFVLQVKRFREAGKWRSWNNYPYLEQLLEKIQDNS
jgi:hypothetical protein